MWSYKCRHLPFMGTCTIRMWQPFQVGVDEVMARNKGIGGRL